MCDGDLNLRCRLENPSYSIPFLLNSQVPATPKLTVSLFGLSSPMRLQGLSWFLLIFLLQILFVARVSTQCLDDQRSLLLQLKSSLVFNSTFSAKLVNWNQSDECCKWDGVDCDGAGRVIGLDLENETISDGIENSTALFRLQYLEKLNLAFNLFYNAQIPKGLENLTNLEYLNLSNAGFGGQIPIEVSKLRSLVILDLSTLFEGYQPLKLENPNLKMLVQNLPRLRELYLDYVNMSAQTSDWCQALSPSLPDLTSLSLRSCGLSGPLDSSLSELHSLSVLHLDGNNLSTTVPGFIAEFSNLTTLTLVNCFLQGTLPDAIFQVPTLQTLDLSFNRELSGTIPQFPVSSSFRTILLSYTNFSGLLPNSIANLRELSQIELSNSNFTGEIPSTICTLTQLVHLDLSVNSFNGSIPLCNMSKKLTYIDLSGNFLTGSLSPWHFEGHSGLAILNIKDNFLNGKIPTSLFDLPSLQKLQLSNNKFSGRIDEFSPSNHSSLDTLDLSGNQFEGSIPNSFFELEQLNVLSLSWNLFNGTVELEKLQKLSSLTRLELGYNKLTVAASSSSFSSLPLLSRLNLASCNLYNFPDLRYQSELAFLDLSNNHITGEIPSWIWTVGGGGLLHLNLSSNLLVGLQKPVNMPLFVSVIDIHSNRLRGELPVPPESASYVDYSNNNFQQPIPVNILNSISFLMLFSLANNSLTGAIPASLCSAVYVQVLDLSDNHLSGSIPSCLVGSTASIGVLNLRGNNISGDMPDTFSDNCGLQTLDLSNNNLEGKMPPSLANCKYLQVMNVGNNKIDDTFPCWLKNSLSLRVLVLRNNKFHGDLSCSKVNGSWPNLQIIDIASNNFSGELYPRYFARWRGMVLDDKNALSKGDHLRFEFLSLSNLYYQDTVTVTLKGLEMELTKILAIFTAIDFSGNKFSGEIPQTVGDLSTLYVLNLSHNAFTGIIPNSIGNLKQLGSLDLSMNILTGDIPKELTNLNFLSFLNLSFNKLIGKIPQGSQFQTFSAASFAGNLGLCGFPLVTSCDSSTAPEKPVESLIEREYDWQLIITGLGYGSGLLSLFLPVALCKQWREYYSTQLDQFLMLIFPTFMNKHGRRLNNRRRR